MKTGKRGAPDSVRPFVSAGNVPAEVMHNGGGVMHNLPRARTRVVGQENAYLRGAMLQSASRAYARGRTTM